MITPEGRVEYHPIRKNEKKVSKWIFQPSWLLAGFLIVVLLFVCLGFGIWYLVPRIEGAQGNSGTNGTNGIDGRNGTDFTGFTFREGYVVLNASGLYTVSDALITNTTRIYLTAQPGEVEPTGSMYVKDKTTGVGFTIRSTEGATDANVTVGYLAVTTSG
jgi:hypothetical protein